MSNSIFWNKAARWLLVFIIEKLREPNVMGNICLQAKVLNAMLAGRLCIGGKLFQMCYCW